MTPDMARQFGNPTGAEGVVIACAMHAAHGPDYAAVMAELPLTAGMRVLEIGMGAGLHVPELMARGIKYCGMDRSTHMVAAAQMAVPSARFVCADVCDGNLPACDAAFTVNSVQWWSDAGTGFRAIREALVPGGLFMLGVSAAPPSGLIPAAGQRHYAPDELRMMLRDAGFSRVSSTLLAVAKRPYILARGVA